MGYLSGSSPQIKSGAISALSVLVFQDADLCLSVPDLFSSMLDLLHNKAVEVIKVSAPHILIQFPLLSMLLNVYKVDFALNRPFWDL